MFHEKSPSAACLTLILGVLKQFGDVGVALAYVFKILGGIFHISNHITNQVVGHCTAHVLCASVPMASRSLEQSPLHRPINHLGLFDPAGGLELGDA